VLDGADGEEVTAAATAKTAETLDPPTAQPARPKRRPRAAAKKPGATKKSVQPDLVVRVGKVPEYTPGTLQDAIRELRAADPNRSVGWLAQKTGQPRSYIRSALGLPDDGETS
jgi:hypothetical protein